MRNHATLIRSTNDLKQAVDDDAAFQALTKKFVPDIARAAAVERCKVVLNEAFGQRLPTADDLGNGGATGAKARLIEVAGRHGWDEEDLLGPIDQSGPQPVSAIDAEIATRRLKALIDEFDGLVKDYYHAKAEGAAVKPPARVIKGRAGLGKTRKVLEAICDILDRLRVEAARVHQSILYLVPTLTLAEDVAREYRKRSGKVHVIRGRSALIDPTAPNGERACLRAEEVDKAAKVGMSIRSSFCHDGEKHCAFWGRCRWSLDEEIIRRREPGMLFVASHEYVRFAAEGLHASDLYMQVIDESFWQMMVRHQRIRLRRFIDASTRCFKNFRRLQDESGEDFERRRGQAEASMRALLDRVGYWLRPAAWLEQDYLRIDALMRIGVTADACDEAALNEGRLIRYPRVSPDMDVAAQMASVDEYGAIEARRYAQVWRHLANAIRMYEATGDGTQHQSIEVKSLIDKNDAGEEETDEFILLHWSVEIERASCPTLILDADANQEICTRFLPQTDFHEVTAPWSNCTTVQIVDRALSMSALGAGSVKTTAPSLARTQHRNQRRLGLLGDVLLWDAERRRGRALIANDERDERPLLAAYKGVSDVLRGMASSRWHVGHQGGLRGLDMYRLCAAILVAGRLQPRVEVIEDDARALFWKDPRQIEFLALSWNDNKDAWERVFPVRKEPIRIKDAADGGFRETLVDVAFHPDPLCDALLRQIREAEISQSLARARLIHRRVEDHCVVVIASNIPVPGVVVDEVTTWDGLVPDRFEEMFVKGLVVEKNIDVPLFYPSLFRTEEGAKKARQRRAAVIDGGNADGDQTMARRWFWAPQTDTDDDRRAWYVSGETSDWWEMAWTIQGPTGRRTTHAARLRPLADETPTQALARFIDLLPIAISPAHNGLQMTRRCLAAHVDLPVGAGPKAVAAATNRLATTIAIDAAVLAAAKSTTESPVQVAHSLVNDPYEHSLENGVSDAPEHSNEGEEIERPREAAHDL